MSYYEDVVAEVMRRQQAGLQRYGIEELGDVTGEPISIEQARSHCRVDTWGSPPISDEDDWFNDFGIPGARELCEMEKGRAFAPRSMRLVTNAFPTIAVDTDAGAAVPLRFGPVQSITSVVYLSQDAYDAAYDAAYQVAYDAAYQVAYDAEILNSGDPELADAAGIAAGDAAGIAAGTTAGDAALEVTMPDTDYVLDNTTSPSRLLLAYGASWPTGLRSVSNAVQITYVTGYSLPTDSPQVHRLPKTALIAMLMTLAHLYRQREAVATAEQFVVPMGAQTFLGKTPGGENLDFA